MADVHGSPGDAAQVPASAWDIQAPYDAGSLSPIQVHGDADAGGRDDVSGTVAGAVAAAEARFSEHQSDTFGQGSVIGDLMSLPANSLDPAVGVQGAEGAYYDPPRGY